MNKKKVILTGIAVALAAGAGIGLFGRAKGEQKVVYKTATVTKGEISASSTRFTWTITPR